MNLVINARDALGSGGCIEIHTEVLSLEPSEDPLPYGIEAPGEYVVLKVKDDGAGIPLDLQTQIFDPFFTTKGPGQGTGLGLATVYGIVRQFHGTLDLLSEPGQGTEFRLAFPRVLGEVETEETPTSHDPNRRIRILVAEDDPSVRLIISEMLELMDNCNARVVASPEEALDVAEGPDTLPLDLLISDIVMPGMDGFQLADRMVERYPKLKVLFVSGYDPESMDRSLELRARSGFLSKPFSLGALQETVHETMTHGLLYRSGLGVDTDPF